MAIAVHLEECSGCCDLLEGCVDPLLARLGNRDQDVEDQLPAAVDSRNPTPADILAETLAFPGRGLRTRAETPWQLGDFRVIRELGRGGMGIVYEAVQESLHRHVALKVLHTAGPACPGLVQRFDREARAAAQLHHTNIVPIFGVGEHNGIPYYAMQFIEGHSLEQVLETLRRCRGRTEGGVGPAEVPARLLGSPLLKSGPGYWHEVARIGIQVADALAHAHHHGVVHRDIKPSNLLLDGEGTVWVADFGLAKGVDQEDLTRTGEVMGTLRYMPPEAFTGQTGTGSDIYALGLTLYELAVGRPAFQAADAAKLIHEVQHREPARPRTLEPQLPRDLETIILKASDKEPASRYESAAVLAEDLRRFLADEPITARPVSPVERLGRWCRRNPTVAGLLATVALVLTVGTVVSWVFAIRAGERAEAEKAARAEADLKRQEANQASAAAQAANRESLRQLARLHLTMAYRAADGGEIWSPPHWFGQAWAEDPDSSRNEAFHRIRLETALDRLPRLAGICLHDRRVLHAAFDPAGRHLLTRTGDRAYLWDPFAGERLREFAHESPVLHAVFGPEGKTVITGGTDGTARVWDAATGQPAREPFRHPAAVSWLAVSPEGDSLATACDDGAIRIWPLAGENRDAEPCVLRCDSRPVQVGFRPDGKAVVCVLAQGVARLWTKRLDHPLSPVLQQRCDPNREWDPLMPAFSADSQRFATWTPDEVTIRDAEGAVIQTTKMGGDTNAVMLSPDGQKVLVTQLRTAALLIDLATADKPRQLNHPRQAYACSFSANGRWAATLSTGGLIHLWNTSDGKETVPRFRVAGDGMGVGFSPDGRYLLAWGSDGSARVWEISDPGRKADSYDFGGGAAHRSGRWPGPKQGEWHVCSPDGKSRLIVHGNTAKLARPGQPETALPHDQPVVFARFAGAGRHVLTATVEAVRVWEMESGQPVGPPIVLPAGPSSPLEVSDDGGRAAGHLKDGTGWVWDMRTGRALLGPLGGVPRQKDSPDVVDPLFALAPDGRFAAFKMGIDSATRVRVFDLDAGRHFDTPPHSWVPIRPAFGKDDRRVLIAGSDTIARIWDTATGQPVGPPLRHPTFVRKAALGPDGRQVATVANDRVLRVWDGETGDLLTPGMPAPFGQNTATRELWFGYAGTEVLWRPQSGAVVRVRLPSFTPPLAMVRPLLRLLSARELDLVTNGLAPLEEDAYRSNPETYLQAWRAWRGSR